MFLAKAICLDLVQVLQRSYCTQEYTITWIITNKQKNSTNFRMKKWSDFHIFHTRKRFSCVVVLCLIRTQRRFFACLCAVQQPQLIHQKLWYAVQYDYCSLNRIITYQNTVQLHTGHEQSGKHQEL
ncbi:Hypothetical_protein [Hexamita inflata]|uniref:Hypothetical_protein n=1 Tax=Hexamita inflata TaxID=28002 RepID=A0ABP1HBQ3_9EUKA